MTRKIYSYIIFVFTMQLTGLHAQEQQTNLDSLSCADKFALAILENDTVQFDSVLFLASDINCLNGDGVSPLMFASQQGNLYFMESLINAGADINLVPKNKMTALLGALAAHKHSAAQYLIRNGANLHVSDLNGNTPLHYAAAATNDSLLLFLLNNSVALNQKDAMGYTPLMLAVSENHTNGAELLVEYGADVRVKNKDDKTALTLAIVNGNAYLAELFILNGADKSDRDGKAQDYWYYAMGTGREMTKVLREYKVKRNLLPVIDGFIAGISSAWYNGHFEPALLGGLYESKYNFRWQLELGGLPFVYSTTDNIEGTNYQFWVRNFWAATEIDKYFAFSKSWRSEYGVLAGLKGEYRLGYYAGTSYRPNYDFEFIPLGGIYYRLNEIELKAVYEKRKWNGDNLSRINLQLSFYLNRM